MISLYNRLLKFYVVFCNQSKVSGDWSNRERKAQAFQLQVMVEWSSVDIRNHKLHQLNYKDVIMALGAKHAVIMRAVGFPILLLFIRLQPSRH